MQNISYSERKRDVLKQNRDNGVDHKSHRNNGITIKRYLLLMLYLQNM